MSSCRKTSRFRQQMTRSCCMCEKHRCCCATEPRRAVYQNMVREIEAGEWDCCMYGVVFHPGPCTHEIDEKETK